MRSLPGHFAEFLRGRLQASAWNVQAERRYLLKRLAEWRRRPRYIEPLPGYQKPPANAKGKDHPPGWSLTNFHRIANDKTKIQQIQKLTS